MKVTPVSPEAIREFIKELTEPFPRRDYTAKVEDDEIDPARVHYKFNDPSVYDITIMCVEGKISWGHAKIYSPSESNRIVLEREDSPPKSL